MPTKNKKYVIGVDGGGAKTAAALADFQGRVLAKAKTGSSHPRNLGLEKAINNLALAIKKVLRKNKKIYATFFGLPAMEEEFKSKKELIKKELLKHKEISSIFKGKIIISSDQLVGFRSGTEKKFGIVLNAGSGSVAHGWRGKREAKACGWGYLSEMGSAFFVGQKTLQVIFKSLDSRSKKTLLTKLAFQELKIKTKEELIRLVYSKKPIEIIPSLSIFCARSGARGDKAAKKILIEAGEELALSVNTVIKKLNFQKQKFPLVLIGSMFNSKIILNTVKKEIKKVAPKAQFIRPKQEPVMGAIKLAIDEANASSPRFANARVIEAIQKMKILKLSPKNYQTVIKEAVDFIKEGKVIICPTDTIYGLIADATNKKAVERIFEIKKRPKTKPIPIFVRDLKQAKDIAKINKKQEEFLNSAWPGKVTAVLERKKIKTDLYGIDKKTIGLRVPRHKLINDLIKKIDHPLVETSVNISNQPPITKIEKIIDHFKNRKLRPDLIIDAGNLKPSKPSLVIDLIQGFKILRK